MPPSTPLLSKSRFIRGYDCPLRLRHALDRCPSVKDDDEFLELLANGGFQFEQLVRTAWPGEELRSRGWDPDGAHAHTLERIRALLTSGGGVLHEATLKHGELFTRVDMLRIRDGSLDLCEIKATTADVEPGAGPFSGETVVLNQRGRVAAEWLRYVSDLAFQVVVAEQALGAAGLGHLPLRPYLVVANGNARCGTLDSFGNVEVRREPDGYGVETRYITEPPPGFRTPLIAELEMAVPVALLRTGDAGSKSVRWKGWSLDDMVEDARRITVGELHPDPQAERGWICRDCEFRLPKRLDDPATGFQRCWGPLASATRELFHLHYGGGYRPVEAPGGGARQFETSGEGKSGARVPSQVSPTPAPPRGAALARDWVAPFAHHGMETGGVSLGVLPEEMGDGTRARVRSMQIRAVGEERVVLADDFASRVQALRPSTDTVLHFVDFETSGACLPYTPGLHPYEQLAFQFSLHSVPFRHGQAQLQDTRENGWLAEDASVPADPLDDDRAFVDGLHAALGQDDGPVFHWASHERTILSKVAERIQAGAAGAIPGARPHLDDPRRLAFLAELLGGDEEPDPTSGGRGRLVDMLAVARGAVMHLHQQGRYSIKTFLPAICRDEAPRRVITHLMGWSADELTAEIDFDPYRLLPPLDVFGAKGGLPDEGDGAPGESGEAAGGGHGQDHSAGSDDDPDGIRSGSDAIRAFQQIRFPEATGTPPERRARVIELLKAYCRLDTAAMVAVWVWLDGLGRSE